MRADAIFAAHFVLIDNFIFSWKLLHDGNVRNAVMSITAWCRLRNVRTVALCARNSISSSLSLWEAYMYPRSTYRAIRSVGSAMRAVAWSFPTNRRPNAQVAEPQKNILANWMEILRNDRCLEYDRQIRQKYPMIWGIFLVLIVVYWAHTPIRNYILRILSYAEIIYTENGQSRHQ